MRGAIAVTEHMMLGYVWGTVLQHTPPSAMHVPPCWSSSGRALLYITGRTIASPKPLFHSLSFSQAPRKSSDTTTWSSTATRALKWLDRYMAVYTRVLLGFPPWDPPPTLTPRQPHPTTQPLPSLRQTSAMHVRCYILISRFSLYIYIYIYSVIYWVLPTKDSKAGKMRMDDGTSRKATFTQILHSIKEETFQASLNENVTTGQIHRTQCELFESGGMSCRYIRGTTASTGHGCLRRERGVVVALNPRRGARWIEPYHPMTVFNKMSERLRRLQVKQESLWWENDPDENCICLLYRFRLLSHFLM